MNKKILNFLAISFFSITTTMHSTNSSYIYLLSKIKASINTLDQDAQDEKLWEELLEITDNCYQKIIKLTAMYFSGVLMSSEQFHYEILFEISKHLLESGQIIALYWPKFLQNPKVSWKIKAKRCVYISSFLILTYVWIQHIYSPKNQAKLNSANRVLESYPQINGLSSNSMKSYKHSSLIDSLPQK